MRTVWTRREFLAGTALAFVALSVSRGARAAAPPRGTFGFEVDDNDALLANDANLDKLRRLWADRNLLPANQLGPGVTQADGGAWHVACHLVAAGCLRKAADGKLLWLEISHVAADDTYRATLTHDAGANPITIALDSADARALLAGSTLLGFIEGTSEGHITARSVQDQPGRFGIWMRQTYDQPPDSHEQGGRVWEHWCTTRDLKPASALSVSLLKAYLQLCNAAGDRFAPTVARGRKEYSHPDQLKALIKAGLTTQASASWATQPKVIPPPAERLLYEARATDALAAAKTLSWGAEPTYYMYQRRIGNWAG